MNLLPDVIARNLPYLLWGEWPHGPVGGLLLTLLLAIASTLLSMLAGMALAIATYLAPRWVKVMVFGLADFLRGIPLLLVVFWFYFLLPILFKKTPDVGSLVMALSTLGSATVLDSTYSAMSALPKGQSEAAFASGLGSFQTLRYILLPQALRNALPSYVNVAVSLTKDTSMASMVGIPELTMLSGQVNNRELLFPMQIYLCCGAMYFMLCWLIQGLFKWLDVKEG